MEEKKEIVVYITETLQRKKKKLKKTIDFLKRKCYNYYRKVKKRLLHNH